jgi:hypothetical protein
MIKDADALGIYTKKTIFVTIFEHHVYTQRPPIVCNKFLPLMEAPENILHSLLGAKMGTPEAMVLNLTIAINVLLESCLSPM